MDKKIKTWIERKLAEDADYASDCAEYDNIVDLRWELPKSLAVYDWVRVRRSTVGRDVIKQSCNIFDTFNPKYEILPRGPQDQEPAERLERWGEWQMRRANQGGETEPFREVLRHSVTYDKICAQVEYYKDLPHDKLSDHPFCIYLHRPALVHSDMGGGVLRRLVMVDNKYASDVLEHWEPYSGTDSVKSAVAELQRLIDADPEQRVVYADYVDDKTRLVFFEVTTSKIIPDGFTFGDETKVLLDVPNTRGFIPWAVVKGSSGSILESLYKSGLIENQNFLDTLADSTVVRRAFFPLLKHTSATNKELEVDYSAAASGVIEQGPGESTEVMIPPPLDPGVQELMNRNAGKMSATSGVQNLSSIDAVNVQSATLNTVVQLRMTELEPYKRNAEKVLAQILKIVFLFVKKADARNIESYRTSDSRLGKKGEQIVLSPDEFNPADLIITCTLLPNTPNDFMQKANVFATLAKMEFPIPVEEFVERMDFGDPDTLRLRWQKEKVENAQLQAFLAEIQAAVQLKMQAAQLQMQQQAQTPPGANPMQNGQNAPQDQNPMQNGFDQASGDMNNPAMGGNSPYESNPGATQTVMQQ